MDEITTVDKQADQLANPGVSHRFGERDFQRLISAYGETNHMRNAIKAVGFSSATVYTWLAKNPDKLSEFKRSIEAPLFARIGELGQEQHDWRAFAWSLERSFPERYALTTVSRVEHTGTIEHNVKMVSESDLRRMADLTRSIEVEITPCPKLTEPESKSS